MKKPLIIHHRINLDSRLQNIPQTDGVEIDVRAEGKQLILNHEPFKGGQQLQDYLKVYRHSFVIFDIKEAGVEERVIKLAKQYKVNDYFLLDVEFPYLYRAARAGIRDIAVRFSQDESIETVLRYKGMVNWVWIDTLSRLPLTEPIVRELKDFKTCLVSPDRWGRPEDITNYRKKLAEIKLQPDAVMVDSKFADQWR